MEQGSAESLLRAMYLLQSTVMSCVDRKKFPYTRTQLGIFTILAAEGELTMKRIAKYISSSQEQATRAVAPLADAGYVVRRTDPSNRTRVYISLTEQGRQLLEENREVFRQALSAKISGSLSEEEKSALFAAAQQIIDTAEKLV